MALAGKLSSLFRSGDVLILTGILGAGKTVFVRGLAAEVGFDEELVHSPSFTLVNEYNGERPVFHFDLYRLREASELHEIGWEDYLNRDGLIVVEWGEKVESLLPPGYYKIEFGIVDESQREINISFIES